MNRRRRVEPALWRARGSAAKAALGGPLLALLTGCETLPTMMATASDTARRTAQVGWFMVILAAVILAIVIAVLVAAVLRGRRRDPALVDLADPGTRFVVLGGAVFPGIVLTTLFVVGTSTLGIFPARAQPDLTIKVVGHQWWWEIEYLDPDLQNRFATANELHIPVGRSVRLLLTSADVIHSFWVPQLQGKLDLIPGDTNRLTLRADRAGLFEGRCAEYCGMQHAHMEIPVVAQAPAEFAQWMARQRSSAQAPTDSLAALGQRLVAGGPCALCHTVRGTPAQGTIGPELTHVGSRRTIGAGARPNTLAHLEAWIANAPAIKPGVRMPMITQFSGRELRAIATYLGTLR